jgi:hypothetical protein
MWNRSLAGLAAGVVLALSATEVSACSWGPFQFFFGSDTQGELRVNSGVSCSRTLRVFSGAIHSGRVTVPPKNGTATANYGTLTYKSKPGFVGTDSLVFTVTGEDPRTKGRSSISLRVTVSP